MTGILKTIKSALEPKPKEPENKCPKCENNSLVPWVLRVHEGSLLTDNPTIYPVGLRCEKCDYTVVDKPMVVFDLTYKFMKNDFDSQYDMLFRAIERCVIDHRKDCIPQFAWDVVAPRVKKNLAKFRAQECSASPESPLSTPEYWESDDWTLICYEAHGMCVWGFD